MKRVGTYFTIVLLSIVIFLFGFNYSSNKQASYCYKVYLNEDFIGYIDSREELEKYIDKQAGVIKENLRQYEQELEAIETYNKTSTKVKENLNGKAAIARYLINNKSSLNLNDSDIENLNYYLDNSLYNLSPSEINEITDYVNKNEIYSHVEHVYVPNGIEIKKVYTYNAKTISVEEAYKKIISKESCSVAGYKFVIKSKEEGVNDIVIYTLDKQIFSDAIEKLITIFVNEDLYNKYKTNSQTPITTTGSIIENIYVEEDITYRAVNISTEEKIYTSSKDLSAYLLYGDKFEEKVIKTKTGDSIESIAFDNQLSVQEFLIFNKQYTSRENLLVPGEDVIISKVDPKIHIVVEEYQVEDKDTDFEIVEKYDGNLTAGSVIVTQEGEKGIDRVTQNVKKVNGGIAYVDPVAKQTIKSSIPKVVNIGTKVIPHIGSTTSWGWPTDKGYTLSSYYGYRLQVFGEGNFHSGIDIAGTGYGSNIYAANNGVIEIMEYKAAGYGYHIMINHNNGYYTLYGHMSGFAKGISVGSIVSRGQVIGYVGSSGWSTGPHLHFEIRTCPYYSCVTNPLNYY